jgi:uncharacterized protein (DUF302 family)
MSNKFTTLIAALMLSATMAMAAQGMKFYVSEGNQEEAYNELINEKIESIGYVLSDPHERINDAYLNKYGTKVGSDGKPNPAYMSDFKETLDNLGFFSVTNDAGLRPLLLKAPELGGFSPFNLHIFKRKGEDKTYVGHVMPETMLDIVGVTDPAVRKDFTALFPALDALVEKEVGGKAEYVEYKSLTKSPMMKFELEFERPEDLSEFVDEFQEQFEGTFEENKYIIAGYKNFKEAYNDMEEEFDRYDKYWVYSLCHFVFSESIFNKGRPEAGAFAPCSMYMYIEKGSNILHIGMPKLENWTSVVGIKDAKMNKSINDLDKEITSIMIGLGAKEI